MYKPISGGKAMDEHEKNAEGDDAHIEKVRRRAHAIWLDQGMVHGRDREHWHQAEQEIAAEEAERATPKAVDPTSPVADAGEAPAKYARESSIKDAGPSPIKYTGESPVKGTGESLAKGAEESPVRGAA
jgi:hypothetical protein